jgi:hypothetical protein
VGTELQFYTRPAAGVLTQVLTLSSTGTSTFNTVRTSGTDTNIITLSDNVTGLQTSGFGVRILATSNNGQAKSAIAFEADGGTNNDTAISFYTQTSAASLDRRMIINKNGNVGINTTGPSEKLQVNGNGLFQGSSTVTASVKIASGNQWSLNADQSGGGSPIFAASGFYLRNENTTTTVLGFAVGGAATFNSSINSGAAINAGTSLNAGTAVNASSTVTGPQGIRSESSSLVIPFTTWTTITTVDANTMGLYLLVIGLTGGGLSDWSATGILYSNGTTATWTSGPTNGTLVQLRISGTAIQVYQNGGSPSQTLSYKLLKVM